MAESVSWITPDWPAPAKVQAVSTTRLGGSSTGCWQSFNLGRYSGDKEQQVLKHRRMLAEELATQPSWLHQQHGIDVLQLEGQSSHQEPEVDAAVTEKTGLACTVLSADCLPVLLCDRKATVVAAAHAGWRGLAAGVLENTVTTMKRPGAELMAWMGPAIGPDHFEVGEEVRTAFLAWGEEAEQAFKPNGRAWMADLYTLARLRLKRLGIHGIYGGDCCTYSDETRFFSYRRDGVTGRMASLIWLMG